MDLLEENRDGSNCSNFELNRTQGVRFGLFFKLERPKFRTEPWL